MGRCLSPFQAASIQFNPRLNRREENIDALFDVVRKAAEQGSKLIVTPEMATTGYGYEDRKAISPVVDTIPGYTTHRFEWIARQYGVYIVLGMPEVERETGLFYNAAALIGPEGYLGKYRKLHQWAMEETWACWGDIGVPVFPAEIGRIAIMICMDAVYFETARLAALQGADILAFPTNSSGQTVSLLQARARSNGLYIVSANRSNTEKGYHMVGASAIWSPYGERLAATPYLATSEQDANEPSWITARIDPGLYDNPAKDRLRERRPELYADLLLHVGSWGFPEDPPRHAVVTVLQYEPVFGNKAANLGKVEQLLRETAFPASGERLIVLPELSLTGPVSHLRRDQIRELAEATTEPTVREMKRLARLYGASMIFGMIEKAGDTLYNSAVLLDPEGEMVGIYRKTHLEPEEKVWATPGDEIPVYPSKELGRVGLMLGYEAAFPEMAGLMAVKRADIVVIPSSWRGGFGCRVIRYPGQNAPSGGMLPWDAVARDVQSPTVVANFVGTSHRFQGGSAVYTLDSDGESTRVSAASGDKEETVVSHIFTAQERSWFHQETLNRTRRTHFYKPLVLPMKSSLTGADAM